MINRIKISLYSSIITAIFLMLFTGSILAWDGQGVSYSVLNPATNTWTAETSNGGEIGTDGTFSALRINIDAAYAPRGGISYMTHNQDAGWSGWVGTNEIVGNNANPIQAVRIQLTDALKYYMDVYYRVHVPNVGWSGWAKNGEVAGSEGLNRNCNLIQIQFQDKGTTPAGQIGNAYSYSNWMWPVPGNYSVSSEFGPRWGAHHDGFDIPAAQGTPIISAKSGIVKMSAPDGNLGNCVAIEHDSGETVYYAHMVRTNCNVGDRVNQGQGIGFVGSTGNSQGPHLHMEIYDELDDNVNPREFYR